MHILPLDDPLNLMNVAFSPDGHRLATIGSSVFQDAKKGTLMQWDMATGKETLTLKRQGIVAFSPDGSRLAAAGGNQTVKLWDVATHQETLAIKEHGGPVNSVSFGPDGSRLASASIVGTIKIRDIRPVELTFEFGSPL